MLLGEFLGSIRDMFIWMQYYYVVLFKTVTSSFIK